MEIARKLALQLIDLKESEKKLDFWEKSVSKYSEGIRSLVRELVNRFHNHKDALEEPVAEAPSHPRPQRLK